MVYFIFICILNATAKFIVNTVVVPKELMAELAKNKKANQFFKSLSYGYKKEFVELVTTAKQEKTKQERIAKVINYCAEGKKLNDKYKKPTSV